LKDGAMKKKMGFGKVQKKEEQGIIVRSQAVDLKINIKSYT
jgi:hypothetical protein